MADDTPTFRGIENTARETVQFTGQRVLLDKRQSFKTSKGTPVYYAAPKDRNRYNQRTCSRTREEQKAAKRVALLRRGSEEI